MKKRISGVLFAVILFCFLAGIAWAVSISEQQQLSNFKASTLKGLSGVAVTVQVVRDRPETLSLLKEDKLKREVEFILQKAGIETLPPAPEVGLYVVLVKVASADADNLSCAVHVGTSLMQIVNLSRDTTIRTQCQTWPAVGQGRFGVVSIAIAKSMVERTAKEQAKEFADDYKAANPRPAANTP